MAPWRDAEPRLMRCRRGWLALTPKDHPYRVGVIGADEAEARRRFTVALESWKDLHERAQQESKPVH